MFSFEGEKKKGGKNGITGDDVAGKAARIPIGAPAVRGASFSERVEGEAFWGEKAVNQEGGKLSNRQTLNGGWLVPHPEKRKERKEGTVEGR